MELLSQTLHLSALYRYGFIRRQMRKKRVQRRLSDGQHQVTVKRLTDSTTEILAEKESPSSSCSPEKVTTHPARKESGINMLDIQLVFCIQNLTLSVLIHVTYISKTADLLFVTM